MSARKQRKPLTDEQRINRRLYRQQPEVRQRMAIKRAIKNHTSPPSISFGLMKPPVGKF
jgi:hypothetical protein